MVSKPPHFLRAATGQALVGKESGEENKKAPSASASLSSLVGNDALILEPSYVVWGSKAALWKEDRLHSQADRLQRPGAAPVSYLTTGKRLNLSTFVICKMGS